MIIIFTGRLSELNVDKAADFVRSCLNFDGGFGSRPGAESHAGKLFFLETKFGSWKENESSGFRRIFTVAFLLFLAHVVGL